MTPFSTRELKTHWLKFSDGQEIEFIGFPFLLVKVDPTGLLSECQKYPIKRQEGLAASFRRL